MISLPFVAIAWLTCASGFVARGVPGRQAIPQAPKSLWPGVEAEAGADVATSHPLERAGVEAGDDGGARRDAGGEAE